MKLSIWKCPKCGEPAIGTCDLVPGVALFSVIDAEGNTEYFGETKVDWDKQEPLQHPTGGTIVTCANGHEWPTEILASDVELQPGLVAHIARPGSRSFPVAAAISLLRIVTNFSDEKLVEMFGWPHFNGFTADRCGGCEKTANVPCAAGWFCQCGYYNILSWGNHDIPHKAPELGPSRERIEAAVKTAREMLETAHGASEK